MPDTRELRNRMNLVRTGVVGLISLCVLGAVGGVMLAGYIVIVHS